MPSGRQLSSVGGENHMRERLGGLYLVIDPTPPEAHLLRGVEEGLKGGVDVLQVWNPWNDRRRIVELSTKIGRLAKQYDAPLIVDNDLELAEEISADGLHLEQYNMTPTEVRKTLGSEAYVGYTVGNDISRGIRADKEGANYISFCAIFPSPSVNDCEIVPLDRIREIKQRVKISVFASGGITAQNAGRVIAAGADGIAVISAILKANDPQTAAKELKSVIARNKPSEIKPRT